MKDLTPAQPDNQSVKELFAESFDLIVDATNIGLWDWDLRTGRVIYSQQWERIAGYEEGELPQDVASWENSVLPEDLQQTNAVIQRMIDGHTPNYVAEFRMLKKDGSIIWAQDRGTIRQRDEQGRPIRLVGILQDVTHIKLAEERIKQQTEQLEFVAKTAGLATWDWDLRTNTIRYASDYFALLGYEQGELDGTYEQWASFCHPEDLERTNRALDDYIEGRTKNYINPMRMRHKDGHYVWTQDVGRIAEWDPQGKPTRVLGGHFDIDDFKRNEERLQAALAENRRYADQLQSEVEKAVRYLEESRRDSQILFDANPYVSVIFSDQMQVLDCNPAAVEYFGFDTKQDLVQGLLPLLVHSIPSHQPTGRESVPLQGRIAAAINDGFCEFETELLLQGKATPMHITLKKIPYGESFAIACYQVDLGMLKEARSELMRQAWLLREINAAASRLMAATPESFGQDIVASLGQIGRSVGAQRMYLWENFLREDQPCCRQVFEWADEEDPRHTEGCTREIAYRDAPHWYDTLRGGQSINSPVRELPATAQRALLEAQGVLSVLVIPVFLQGEFWGFVGLDCRQSERSFTEAEESILRSGSILLVSATLRNMITENLILAREEALENTRAKSRFLANMSHEIRTPMNAIIGMTTIAQESADPQKIDDCLSKIHSASRLLLGIINDVLDMSKIEARKFQLAQDEFSLRRVLENICNMNIGRIEEKAQSLSVEIDDALPAGIITDEVRFSQVVTNLLSNAIKFTPEGGSIALTARQIAREDDTATLQICVQDTGIGIKPDIIKVLFHPFEQGAVGISRNYGGTGLGLAISKSIIEQMGGSIEVESEFGEGSRFWFTITVPVGQNADIERDPEPVMQTDDYDFGGKRILLAEDLEINRIVVSSLLDFTNADIDAAENGLIAYEKFAQAPDAYDIIFMDIHMPVLDGLGATRKIRAIGTPRSKEIPIIAMTASAFAEDIQACKEAGMNDHVAKPIDLNDLLTKTKKHLFRH